MALLKMALYPFKCLLETIRRGAGDKPIEGGSPEEILLRMVRKAERDSTRRLKADPAVSRVDQTQVAIIRRKRSRRHCTNRSQAR